MKVQKILWFSICLIGLLIFAPINNSFATEDFNDEEYVVKAELTEHWNTLVEWMDCKYNYVADTFAGLSSQEVYHLNNAIHRIGLDADGRLWYIPINPRTAEASANLFNQEIVPGTTFIKLIDLNQGHS